MNLSCLAAACAAQAAVDAKDVEQDLRSQCAELQVQLEAAWEETTQLKQAQTSLARGDPRLQEVAAAACKNKGNGKRRRRPPWHPRKLPCRRWHGWSKSWRSFRASIKASGPRVGKRLP